jgi:hypothetical protein
VAVSIVMKVPLFDLFFIKDTEPLHIHGSISKFILKIQLIIMRVLHVFGRG